MTDPELIESGALLRTFSPDNQEIGFDARLKDTWRTAIKWQSEYSATAQWAEIAAHCQELADDRPVIHNRIAETFGHAARIGEQIGIAATATADALRWIESTPEGPHRTMAARALAGIAVGIAVSCGHGLINITIGVVHARGNTGWKPKCPDRDSYWRTTQRAPFDEVGRYAALTKQDVKKLCFDAAELESQDINSLVQVVVKLQIDSRWRDVIRPRNDDAHGWREQSVAGGVPKTAPWVREGDTMSFGNHYQGVGTPDPVIEVDRARAVLDAVTQSMRDWDAFVPAAYAALGLTNLRTW